MKTRFHTATIAAAIAATVGSAPPAMAQVLEEVVVTAQRRAENVQEVAIAVTSVSTEEMEAARVFNIENISAVSPSISFKSTQNASSSGNIQIRGIGTTGGSRSFEGAVGVFVDGVYRTRSGQALAQFLDIEQLQVLRGPQGTLFGKNTAAGAVLLDSTAPDMDSIHGNVTAEVGNYNHSLLKGAVNVPLGDRAAARFAALKFKRDGFFEDPTDGDDLSFKDDLGFKGQFLFQPTDTLEFKIIADYAKSDDDCCYATNDEIDGPLQPLIDGLTAANGSQVPSKDRDAYEAVTNPNPKNEVSDSGIAVYAKWDLGVGELSYVGANRKYEVDQLVDADFSGADILDIDEAFESKFTSHELTFAGQLEDAIKADYLFGVYTSSEDLAITRDGRHGSQAQQFWDAVFGAQGAPPGTANAAPGLLNSEIMKGSADSLAVFTHWDISLSEKFSLILGARYTEDKKEGSHSEPFFRDPLFDPFALAGTRPAIAYDEDFEDESVSGTVTVQYFHSNDAMIYATYNKGYKAGGVNLDATAAGTPGSPITGVPAEEGNPVYKSETVESYELGIKADWLEGRARTNAAVFYSDVTELQNAQFLGLRFAIQNAPEAEVYGLEFEGLYQLTDSLRLAGGFTWLPTAEFGDDASLGALAGRDFSTAPEWAANTVLSGSHQATENFTLDWRTEVIYRDEVFTNTDNNNTQDALTLVNASIGIAPNEANWRVMFFVQNLTEENYVTTHFNTPLQGSDINGYIGAPRTFGLSASREF
ncbi:TonB-dependent receptor [Spongiibacter sp. KMU-166]|uniref:TonB-dependent receptor n=1 Tax=Spongiibacter thalassae TaxID=2721624 RepID=A0ABX1G9T6_9GAMM|nr:TonB-dependent receptor [Spongiibacter thalassae]NKI15913.1 TonB-dependent receptor [Spongiibacter thalassae]